MTRDTIPCPPPMPDGWEVSEIPGRVRISSGYITLAAIDGDSGRVSLGPCCLHPYDLDVLVAIIRHYTTRPDAAVRIEAP